MNTGRKRRLAAARGAVSRFKCSKNEETECRPGGSTHSPSPDCEPGSSPAEEVLKHPNNENSPPSKRAAKSKACSQALYPAAETEGLVPNVKCGLYSEDETEKTLVITVDNEQSGARQSGRRKGGLKRKQDMSGTSTEAGSQQEEEENEDEIQPEVEIDQELDRELENKSRQHNLTSANVRSIIHEVITNEHVVAMMKAAINDTEPVPLFEPKMTRSKLKEVVEKGVVIPTWNISPIKKPNKVTGPQFVDIPLEEEDSSDEEYCPDEEEDDETAEETLLESDLESTASSPRGTRLSISRSFSEYDGENSPRQSLRRARHLRVEVVPMGPPPPPQGPEPSGPSRECSFMEKLHAVDEELAIGSDCMDTYQSLSSSGEDSLMAFRTRSKRPLRDVPLGRLEAELRAPDITPDMYEQGSAPEDVEWTRWLQGLMSSDVENEEEGDDEDDPEYNFLADIDEPDVEDYRNDKAVRITKKEVNELMEELFDAFQDELGGQDEEGHEEEEEKEDDEATQQEPPSILETIQYEDPLADILKQRYRTVKEQLAAIRKRKALLESKGIPIPAPRPKRPKSPTSLSGPCGPSVPSGPLHLTHAQKLHLQQNIQQHVQLLTQVNMLSRLAKGLQSEACTVRQFLIELQLFAQRAEQAQSVTEPGFVSVFRACNLQAALDLLEELDRSPKIDTLGQGPLFSGSQIPAHLAWLMATRPVFLYPELLSEANLSTFHYKGPFTSAENCLIVLGHKHFQGTLHPLQLACHYLLVARNFVCLRAHIRSACQKQSPSIIKNYFLEGKYPFMPVACEVVTPGDLRPPLEREKRLMPYWLSENLKLIYEEVKKYNQPLATSQSAKHKDLHTTVPPATPSATPEPASSSCTFPPGTQYPPWLPETLAMALMPPPPGSLRRKASVKLSAQALNQSSEPSKAPLLSKDVVEALGRLPPILPKSANLSLKKSVHPDQLGGQTVQFNSLRKRPNMKLPSSGTVNVESTGETQMVTSKFKDPADLNQGKLVITLTAAPVEPPSQGNVVVTTKETHAAGSSTEQVALVGPRDENILTLSTTPVATSLNLPSLGDLAVKTSETHITGSSAAQIAPSQGNVIILPTAAVATALICPAPTTKVAPQTPSVLTPLAKDCMSQRCGTLLKLSTGPRIPLGPNPPKSVSQNTLHQFLILPPGCIITNSASHNTILNPEPVTAHNQKPCVAQEMTEMEDVPQSVLGYVSRGHNAVPLEVSSNKGPEASIKDSALLTTVEEEELDVYEVIANEEEQEECGEEGFRKPFLTLSESSGSPTPSLYGGDVAMETVMDEDERDQRQPGFSEGGRGREDMEGGIEEKCLGTVVEVTSPGSETSVLSVPELQETMEKLSRLASKPGSDDKGFADEVQSGAHASVRGFLHDDVSDSDPRRDTKDVAFAQAYLEKACEVLRAVPGKVEEFLGVLYEFEQDPEGRTSVELFMRLKPVLRDWPELLRDFAAFLHPEQAQACGLLTEQQAFERSRQFLRQLELTFGEHSVHYRRVVRTLQQGPSKTLTGSQEMKAQIAMLFRDHTHLLEEYWAFFEQLHPPAQFQTDDGEEQEEEVEWDDTDSVSSVQTVLSVEGSQKCQPIRAHSPEERTEAHRSRIDYKGVNVISQDAEAMCHGIGAELEDEWTKERDTQLCRQASGSPVCAKNCSRMPSGEKVVLWTREADRVILTTCQQRGASQSTFSSIATQLGNKTANEVGARYRDLIKLFHKSTKQHHSSRLDRELQCSPKEVEPD
ncbi:GON-4-like protein isoform X1 [Pygocentrus nattereri]|uniref:Myb-like domain-containing protein n=2 Tax=Pygocentrus nattereri TaxID=42514 RepID=A0A3B4D893_PYGNA|nr:GON-4-like protein isoform X1 [Pygocentrus nattereri]